MADTIRWTPAPQGWFVTVSYSDGTEDTTYGVVAFSHASCDPDEGRSGEYSEG